MIEIKLWGEGKRAHLKFLENDRELIENSINRMFDFVSSEKKGVKTEIVINAPEVKGDKAESEKAAEPKKIRPRRLPFVNGDHSTFNMSELIGENKSICKCSYTCPECNHEGTRLVPFGFRFTFCEECNTKLFLRPAGDNWGDRDEDGNTYIANQVYRAS